MHVRLDTLVAHHSREQRRTGLVELTWEQDGCQLEDPYRGLAFDQAIRRFEAQHAAADDRHPDAGARLLDNPLHIRQGAEQEDPWEVRTIKRWRAR